MDIRCPNCGEPWDMDSLHDEVSARWPDEPWKFNSKHDQQAYERYYSQVRREFYSKGCKAMTAFVGAEASIFNGSPADWCTPPEDERTKTTTAVTAMLYELLGDDLDGAAAMLEDFEMGY